jgi:restriction system protein
MGYRSNDGAEVVVLFVVFGVPILIGLAITRHFFPHATPWLSLIPAAAVFYLIYLAYKGWNVIQRRREASALKKARCEHGIKGGRTLGLCAKCIEEGKQRVEEQTQFRKELERVQQLRERVLELRNQEIARFTKASVGSKEFLYSLHPNEFEDVIAALYKQLGYSVKQTPYSNDKGKDIILKRDGKKYLVECKRYDFANTIGREHLQKFFAAIVEEKAEKGFFVTTSDYKSTAIQYAKDIGKIELVNGSKLVLMMREVYPSQFESNLVSIMCRECGDVVSFAFGSGGSDKACSRGHLVRNDFDEEVLSPKYLTHAKYCVKCGKPMRLVNWKGKQFWGCSGYPRCRSYQRHVALV